MSAQKSKLLGVVILLLTCLNFGCSSTDSGRDNADLVLKTSSQIGCDRGFIRPPGVHNCIYIADIIADKAKYLAPQGRCPTYWQRLKSKGFCLPQDSLISCGSKTFPCILKKGDSLRLIPKLPQCANGTLVLSVDAPMFHNSGELY